MQSNSPTVGGGAGSEAGLAVSEVTYAEQIAEVERELRVRDAVYARWILRGKISAGNAKKQQASMRAVLATLQRASRELRDREPGALFNGEAYGPAKTRADERARVLAALSPMVHSDVYLRLVAKLAKQDTPAPG